MMLCVEQEAVCYQHHPFVHEQRGQMRTPFTIK